MPKLWDFYRNWLLGVALTLALGTHFVATTAIPYLKEKYSPEHWSILPLNFLGSRPILLGLLLLAEWLIRKKLWRLKWFHPELDFSGTWDGISTYTQVHLGTGAPPDPVNHEARIEQDCLSIRLIPAKGDRFVKFESTAVNLPDAHKLVYSYHVVYKGGPGFPNETYGYEEMSPISSGDSKGRPEHLSGWFAHCVRPSQTAAYSGIVTFKRRQT
jgi:hypothetical protein